MIDTKRSPVCVGLDPVVEKLPKACLALEAEPLMAIHRFSGEVIAAVARQTQRNLTTTRRLRGRLVTPFLQSLPGQPPARRTPTSRDMTGPPGEDDAWGDDLSAPSSS